MGLFGGFKAKFSGNSRSKENKTKTGVVVLNYRLSTEFDSVNFTTQLPKPVPIQKQTRPRQPTRSATFEDNNRALLEKLKSKSLINLPNESSNRLPTNDGYEVPIQKSKNVKEEEYNKTNSIYNGSAVKKSNSVKKLPVAEESDNYIYTGASGSLHQYEQVTHIEEDTSSTLIMMTQHSPEDFKQFNKDKVNETLYVPEVIYNDNDEEEFKVNVVSHRNYVSDDELSYVEEEVPLEFNGYSSQAASIFFGNSAPPPIRPRKVNIRKVDDDEEVDC